MIQLKNYQKDAVDALLRKTRTLLGKGQNKSLVFQAPTGSGKTIMMQEFLREFSADDLEQKYAFLWISIGDLAKQSKKSFEKNCHDSKLIFSNLSDVKDQILRDNEILFINWEAINKVDRKTGEWKVLAMRENETGENLPNFLQNTHVANKKIILIVDESHRNLDTPKAQELIQNIIKPALQIEVSATPDSTNIDEIVKVTIEDVIQEWIIKKEVIINEGMADISDDTEGTNEFILKKALEKQAQLREHYEQLGIPVNPLLLIQLPSEWEKTTELDTKKIDHICFLLRDKFDITFENKKLAIWLSNDKTNKELINIKNSPVQVLIFKQAIATGWDCPRAQILIMFRDIRSITFELQTIGRILRMPEQRHYMDDILNKAYIFTDLERAQMGVGESAKNMIKILNATRKDTYKNLGLRSFFKSRSDYNDIGRSFYEHFTKIFLQNIDAIADENARDANLEILRQAIEIENTHLENILMSDGKILVDIDNHTWEPIFAQWTTSRKTESEIIKIECDNFIKSQVRPQFGNIARSYRPILEAIYSTLKKYFFWEVSKTYLQTIVLKNQDFFHEILTEIKNSYVAIHQQEVHKKEQESEVIETWEAPIHRSFGESAQMGNYQKYIYSPAFIEFDSEIESAFVENFLEKSDLVEFWLKNGIGQESFGIRYTDENNKIRTFYPDFIVRFVNGSIGIFDTKSGYTLSDGNTRAHGLQEFLVKYNSSSRKIMGGIITLNSANQFCINKIPNYDVWNIANFAVFNDTYIQNFDFSVYQNNEQQSILSDEYRDELESLLQELQQSLNAVYKEFNDFVEQDRENSGDFDIGKRAELRNNIDMVEQRIHGIEQELLV